MHVANSAMASPCRTSESVEGRGHGDYQGPKEHGESEGMEVRWAVKSTRVWAREGGEGVAGEGRGHLAHDERGWMRGERRPSDDGIGPCGPCHPRRRTWRALRCEATRQGGGSLAADQGLARGLIRGPIHGVSRGRPFAGGLAGRRELLEGGRRGWTARADVEGSSAFERVH